MLRSACSKTRSVGVPSLRCLPVATTIATAMVSVRKLGCGVSSDGGGVVISDYEDGSRSLLLHSLC